jgi:transcriptional regulator with XRE-family HTH domain
MKRTRSSSHLIAARELLGWTKESVAEKLGLAPKSVQVAERGRGSVEIVDRLTALYAAAGVEFPPDGQVQMKARPATGTQEEH